MDLSELVGEHILSGVDMSNEPIKSFWGDYYEDCQVINFILDGITYSAIENPDDGYRSSMEEIKIVDVDVKNVFRGQRVVGRMSDNNLYQINDTIEFIDVVTGKTVLRVGTDNTDDYYPWFVCEFTPENMAINASKES